MNPELPPNPRAELEARLTAYLLGELPAHEAAALRQALDDDAELAKLCDRLKPTIKLVAAASAPAQKTTATEQPLKLSEDRRQKLLAQFKTITPKEFAEPVPSPKISWLALAACAVLALMLAGLFMPALAKSKSKAERVNVISNLRQIDLAKSMWAEDHKKSNGDTPTLDELKPYLGGSEEKLTRSIAGEKYIPGKVGELASAETDYRTSKKFLGGNAAAVMNSGVRIYADGKVTPVPTTELAQDNLSSKNPLITRSQTLLNGVENSPHENSFDNKRIALANGGLHGLAVRPPPPVAQPADIIPVPEQPAPAVAAGSVPIILPAAAPTSRDVPLATIDQNGNAKNALGLPATPPSGTAKIDGIYLGAQLTEGKSDVADSDKFAVSATTASANPLGGFPGINGQAKKSFSLLGPVETKTEGVSVANIQPAFPSTPAPAPSSSFGGAGGGGAGGISSNAGSPQTIATLAFKDQKIPIHYANPSDLAGFQSNLNPLPTQSEAISKNPQLATDRSAGRQLTDEESRSFRERLPKVTARAGAFPSDAVDAEKLADRKPAAGAAQNLPGDATFTYDPNSNSTVNMADDATRRAIQLALQSQSAPAQSQMGAPFNQPAAVSGTVTLKQSLDLDAPLPHTPAPIPTPTPEILTHENAFSTFSLNVADVSFRLAAASLEKGQMPDPAAIRSEEFINAFDYRDPDPAPGAPLGFAWDRAHYPFAHNRDLLRFSVKTAAAGRPPGRALNLVLLLDNSGSMERADRVQIIHEALRVLAAQLQPQDTISIVTFARTPRLWVDGVRGDQAADVFKKVSDLTPQGGTNLEDAMRLAYETARRHYLADGVNRVVLLTDGAANLGNVNTSVLKQKVEENRKQGIALDCFGIGWEGYNDDLLEALSRNGDGRYAFLNTPAEAANDFAGQLAGALNVAAADVKVQVEFNPKRVNAYRQIGYAKHQLTKEQFRDNSVDAAEIGAAESGNALYVIETNPAGEGPVATVHVRFKVPGTAEYREHAWEVPYTGSAPALDQASPATRLAATAGAFAEWLTTSPYAAEVTPDQLLGYLNGVPKIYGADTRPAKLESMIREAKSISGK